MHSLTTGETATYDRMLRIQDLCLRIENSNEHVFASVNISYYYFAVYRIYIVLTVCNILLAK